MAEIIATAILSAMILFYAYAACSYHEEEGSDSLSTEGKEIPSEDCEV